MISNDGMMDGIACLCLAGCVLVFLELMNFVLMNAIKIVCKRIFRKLNDVMHFNG